MRRLLPQRSERRIIDTIDPSEDADGGIGVRHVLCLRIERLPQL